MPTMVFLCRNTIDFLVLLKAFAQTRQIMPPIDSASNFSSEGTRFSPNDTVYKGDGHSHASTSDSS
jgi:hypothetical protein